MLDTEKAIQELRELLKKFFDTADVDTLVTIRQAIQALQEKAEREKGCEYCNGKRNEYQHTIDTKLSINTFGKARVIETECNRCPPYANCCMKNIPARSVFLINFCPNCGRKLNNSPTDEL